jgi:sulfide:quinone oxidoreductase
MTPPPRRVVIAGGGLGGLEAALAVGALAGDRVEIELVASSPHFLARAASVAEPFGGRPSATIDIGRLGAEHGFGVTLGRIWAVDARHRVIATDERSIPYDDLVLALGAQAIPAVPGALTFRGPQDARGVRAALEQLCGEAGGCVVFVASPLAAWPLPAYELALMTGAWAVERGAAVEVTVVTAESSPLQAFGDVATARIRSLLEDRGIALLTDTAAESHRDGRLLLSGAGSIPSDITVALPALVGPSVPGVPHDHRGFVDVDGACRVIGLDHVYAVGDMTADSLKQGGLASQQADVAAAFIASDAGAECDTPLYEPDLRAVLLTGSEPVALGGTGTDRSSPQKISARYLEPHLRGEPELATV